MTRDLARREFLMGSAAVAGAAAANAFTCIEIANAATIDVPTVDKLSIRVLVDSSFDLFFRPRQVNGVSIAPARTSDYRKSLHNEWGLSLWLESEGGGNQRTLMLDYGYTPDVLLNNMALIGVDPSRLDALIVSHGHYDHFGGLMGFLDKFRDKLPADVRLYAGGEDNFCHRVLATGTQGQFSDFGTLDRRELAAHKVSTVLCEAPTVIAGHAFTTGRITRRSIERVLPNTFVEFGIKDGLGCNVGHYLPAEMEGKIVPDEHIHEHATCFNVKNLGLVVISSCGHVGIVNSVKQAQEVSGIDKVHAVVGGFHLGPAPKDYLVKVVGEIKALNPDVVIPMHCSGLNFVQEATAQMGDKVMVSTTGSRITFGT